MEERLLLRELYGPVYVSVLPDGQRVPWKPLPVGEFLSYQDQFASGQYPTAFLENEVFKKCVLNPVLVSQINELLAGVVSTVVFSIMENSGPSDLTRLEELLNRSRVKANVVLHDMIALVCQAFPAYKPEDLYNMDAETFMFRVALAERKLLNTGILKEPLSLSDSKQKPTRPVQQPSTPIATPTPPPVNLAKAHREQQHKEPQTIISAADIREHEVVYTGHEKEDKIVLEHQMVKDTAKFYEDYMQQIQSGTKVQIKTPEERKAEALVRSEQNRQANVKRAKQSQLDEKQELERLAKMRKIQRTVKKPHKR